MVLKYVTKNGVRYHQLDRKSADIVKVVPPSPMPLSGSGTWVEFAPSRRACESRFSKFFFKKILRSVRGKMFLNSKGSYDVSSCGAPHFDDHF